MDQGYRCSVLDIDETVIADRDGILWRDELLLLLLLCWRCFEMEILTGLNVLTKQGCVQKSELYLANDKKNCNQSWVAEVQHACPQNN